MSDRNRASDEAPKYTLGGRGLTPQEVLALRDRLTAELPFSVRARLAVATAGLENWLDLAAALELDVLVVPKCGRVTINELRAAIRRQLAAGDGATREST